MFSLSFRLSGTVVNKESSSKDESDSSSPLICRVDLSFLDPKPKQTEWKVGSEELTCKSCGFLSDSLSNLFQHVEACKKREKIFECSLCGKQCRDRRNIRQHLIVHLDKRPFQCTSCDFSFKRRWQLFKHNQTVHKKVNLKKFFCRTCDWVGESKWKLEMHKENCETTVFHCDVCKKMFAAKSTLENHMAVHNTDRPFPCDLCGARFKSKRNVASHFRIIHQGQKKPKKVVNPDNIPLCQCEICGKSFTSRYGQARHIKEVHGDGHLVCPICGKKLPRMKSYTIHVNTHTGEKPYSCEICGKAFTTKNYIKIHMRIHTGENPYKCSICPKSFKQKGSLRIHYKTNHPGMCPNNLMSKQ